MEFFHRTKGELSPPLQWCLSEEESEKEDTSPSSEGLAEEGRSKDLPSGDTQVGEDEISQGTAESPSSEGLPEEGRNKDHSCGNTQVSEDEISQETADGSDAEHLVDTATDGSEDTEGLSGPNDDNEEDDFVETKFGQLERSTYETLTAEQLEAIEAMFSSENVFVTGPAGSGKSLVINQFRTLSSDGKPRFMQRNLPGVLTTQCVVSTSTSGTSAWNIGCTTINSTLGEHLCCIASCVFAGRM